MDEQLSWLQAIILGISQGLTEFLPISSSAHTLIISKLAGFPDPGAAFTAVSQIGTELAVIIYFWKDIKNIRGKLAWYLALGSLPIVILALIFQSQISGSLRNLYLVSFTLISMGIALGLADKFSKHQKSQEQLNTGNAFLFGIGQALALIPGVSRSGATITFGLAMGFKREFAARYAFLLAIPAVLGSGLYELKDIGEDNFVNWPATILATVVAFLVGYLVISKFMDYLRTKTFAPFVYYRIFLGITLLILLQLGVVTA